MLIVLIGIPPRVTRGLFADTSITGTSATLSDPDGCSTDDRREAVPEKDGSAKRSPFEINTRVRLDGFLAQPFRYPAPLVLETSLAQAS